MKRRLVVIGAAATAVIVLAGGGAYVYFFSGLRSSPSPLALSTPNASASAAPAGGLAGSWTVATRPVAGYPGQELLLGGNSQKQTVAPNPNPRGRLNRGGGRSSYHVSA